MPDTKPPQDHEELIRLIHDRHDAMSRAYQRIGLFLTQNPHDVAVLTVNAMAKRCGIHASSLVRFAQSLGYRGFKDLQLLFQKHLAATVPGFVTRVAALEDAFPASPGHPQEGFLRDQVLRDIASLQLLLEDIDGPGMALAAEMLVQAEVIHLIGQLHGRPVVDLLRQELIMLGKRCVLLDGGGGLASCMAQTIGDKDVLLAVSLQSPASELAEIVQEAGRKGRAIIAITDGSLSPLGKWARVIFPVPSRDARFPHALAAPICLTQALAAAVAARMQDDARTGQLPGVT
ncbi:MurR/RpiR family transcriptional regulator [Paracoccus seriniphilus]|uniref:MurR/RpiR family transcriptional regulator n=1 Tax=Paracoccus seriniphilus TaxID=184748 RepID=UPI0035678BAD